mmetsp:Transcript_5913/g.20864  ORF Transcript_5913/g.20864 Transcript_5913/m.20864 type:complete len:104 (-) Transcript_5913:14-325(-)
MCTSSEEASRTSRRQLDMPPSLTESSASVSEGAQTTTRRLLDTPPALGDMAGEPKVNRSTTFPMMLPRRNGALDDIDFVPCAQRDSANSGSTSVMQWGVYFLL